MELPSPPLKVGDVVNCQVNNCTHREIRFFKRLVADEEFARFIKLMANLVFIGEKRPRVTDLRPAQSPTLKDYLDGKGENTLSVCITLNNMPASRVKF